jgi:HK97 family phage major capsid protein
MTKRYQYLVQQRADLVNEAKKLFAGVGERVLTPEEKERDDQIVAQIQQLDAEIEREERVRAQERHAPAVLKGPRGDNEIAAMAHFVRTGDSGGVSHLLEKDEQGVNRVTLHVPTAYEWRNTPQAAVVDSTMNITTAADGANLVPTGFVNRVAMRKNEQMLAEKLGCQRIPGKGTTVNHPVEAADPEEFATTAEQADNHSVSYERDAGNTGLKAFTLVKKTRKIELTEELLEDNDVDLMGYIGDRMGRQIAGTHNAMLITEAGANGTKFKTFAAAAAIAAGEPEDIIFNDTLAYYLEDDGGSIGWVMRPSTFGDVASLTGNPRLYAQTPGGSFQKELLGYPVNYSNKVAATAASAKDMYFGNWYFMGYREAPELRFIMDPYSVDGMVILKYSFRAVYGVLQAGAVGYGQHPSA